MRTMWNLNKWTDHTALYVREQSYTYGQLDRMQQAFAQKVDSHRLVCVMMTNELPALVNFGTGGFTDGRQRTRDMYFMSA